MLAGKSIGGARERAGEAVVNSHLCQRAVSIALLLAVGGGCGAPLLFQAETIVHGDGSCDRTIWQPEKEMLPSEALTPAWKTRWNTTRPIALPPAFAGEFQASGEQKYFTASGAFPSPAAIPVHYVLVSPEDCNAGKSELVRSYDRRDFGFVLEHRWRETLTNIVTPARFLQARDEFLDKALPLLLKGIDQVYGKSYDVAGLAKYVREDGRRFLEEGAIVYYQVAALHQTTEEQAMAFAELARQYGLDLFDSSGKLVTSPELDKRLMAFLHHRIVLGVRHHDGSRLTESEIQAFIQLDGKSPFAKGWEEYGKQVEKQLKTELGPCLLRMFGLYSHPFVIFAPQSPRFAFSLRLPGELVETNGSIEAPDRTRWKFGGDESFPDGYAMKARSLEIDEPLQQRLLGRVAIADRFAAESYIEILGQSGRLGEIFRGVRQAGDLQGLRDFHPRSREEADRATRLRAILGVSP
jgi:hypothetical protein